MMFADPGRMHANVVCVYGFSDNVGDAFVRRTWVVLIVIVAEREITEAQADLLKNLVGHEGLAL